jgi:Cu+-exporting ATPase
VRDWQSIANRQLNLFTPIALGIGIARIYSTVGLLAPTLFPSSMRIVDGTARRR